jgi:hypothetical protein
MIGQCITSQPRPPLGAIFWVLAAASLDVLAAASGNIHLAVGSVLPWLVALLWWTIRERPFTARFTETALQVEEPPLEVPYADLQGLLAPRRPANPFKAGPRFYAIQLIHADGVVLIPARLEVPSDEVYSFLYRQFSPSGSRAVPSALTDYLRGSERRFGPEQVWTYRARTHLGRGKRYPRLTAFFLALTLAAASWLIWGIAEEQAGWIGGGVIGLMFGGMFSMLLWLDGRRNLGSIRGWRKSGLVVAPDGLALVQGDMVGELRWDEVREVKIGKGTTSFEWTRQDYLPRGIVLKVEGAVIVIADVYDRPLPLIYQNIRYYWQGQPGDDDWDGESLTPPSAADGIMSPE